MGSSAKLGGAAGDEAVLSSAVLRSRSATVLGYANNALTPQQRREAFGAVLRQASAGLVTVAHQTRPLADAAAAWRAPAAGEASPRVVLLP